MPTYDAIVVPGGGVRAGGLLPPWVDRRLDLALARYDGEFIVTLSAGTPHRPPPLDPSGFPIFESVVMAKRLIGAGIPADRVLAETHSWDTIGNAYFSRFIHVDPRGLRRLLVITSRFHLPRTETAFNWVYSLSPPPSAYEIEFAAAPDDGMDPAVLAERLEKERNSLDRVTALSRQITTMPDFHRWLFTEHNAYNAAARAFADRRVAGDLLKSY